MKKFLQIAPFVIGALSFAVGLALLLLPSPVQAQFAPVFTNATLAGSGTKVPSGGTLTIQSGGTLDFSAGTVVGTIPIAGGGTGAITAAAARTNLGLGSLSTLSTISLTTNVSGILPGANGGTGVANTSKTITLGGNLTLSGAFDATFTLTAGTGVTFPVSGTLATLAGSESLTNKKLGSLTSNGVVHTSAGDGTLSVATVTVGEGGTGITSGTSGGIPYFSSSSALASSAAMTANYIILGGGAGAAPAPMGSPGTTTTILHGNASGAPTFGAVSLTAEVSGVLPVANGGTNVSSYTKGDILIASASTTLTKLAVGTDNQVLTANSAASTGVSWATGGGGGGSGNVTGPASSTNTNIVTWNGTAGTSVSDASGVTLASGVFTGTGNITINAGSTAKNIVLNPTTTGFVTVNGSSSGGGLLKISRGGAYDYFIGETSGSVFTIYDNDRTTDLFGFDSNDAHFNLGTGKLWVKGASGGGPFLRISKATAYNYFLGVDSSSNFKFYDNDGSTELWGITQSTGNFKVVNALNVNGTGTSTNAGSETIAKVLSTTPTALTYAAPTSVDVTLGNVFTVTTVNATGSVTFNATAGGTAGQRVVFIITNDATSAKTITFGTNFSANGTLTPSAASKVATIEFISNGTTLYELARTVLP